MNSRGVLTLAFGPSKFVAMAKALARSLILHDPTLPRAIVTDSTDPELDRLFTHRIRHCQGFGSGVRQKMYLDLYSPFAETIFIDCDSFAVRRLDPMWHAFRDLPFGVCGSRTLQAGDSDEYLDVDFALRHFGLESLPKFNGGLYYFNRSPAAEAIFTGARRLLRRSAELGFREHRGDGPCEEPLYAVAMALQGLSGTAMGIGGMETLIGASSHLVLDVPHSICTFVKGGRALAPDIIHFAELTDGLCYKRECRKLKLIDRAMVQAASGREPLRNSAAGLWARLPWNSLISRRTGGGDNRSLPAQTVMSRAELTPKHLA
jgi:hypothetical protein